MRMEKEKIPKENDGDEGCRALIFGLSEEQSKGAILSRCKALLIRAEGRRYGKAVITVSQRGALDEEKSEDETEEMEVDDVEPAQKRLRQTNE
uniref:Uncharacterized protein n=1 Tax=Timema poppense TaxID=170557 RepID=A0A7R9DR92_TIMPO|nr:unnamed protein product [Timema poppensis]